MTLAKGGEGRGEVPGQGGLGFGLRFSVPLPSVLGGCSGWRRGGNRCGKDCPSSEGQIAL